MQGAKMLTAALVLVFLAVATPASATNEIVFNVVENGGKDAHVGLLMIDGIAFTLVNTTGPCQQYFTLEADTGVFTSKVNIDREEIFSALKSNNITCAVRYKTEDCESCSISVFVKFHIVDVNDVTPTFNNLVSPIQELEAFQNIPVNQIIKYLEPRDDDAGENAEVVFQLTSGNDGGYFRIDRTLIDGPTSPNRVLYLNKSLIDVSPDSVFNLTIHLEDKGSPPLTSTQYIAITVKQAGGSNTPVEFPTSSFVFQLVENHPVGIQYPFGQVNVSDDSSSDIFYQFSSGTVDEEITAETFGINPLNGKLYLNQSLDYDHGLRLYELSVEARDPGSITGTHADVQIEVLDTNDEYPQLSIPPSSLSIPENQDSALFELLFMDEDIDQYDNTVGNVTVSFSHPVEHDIPPPLLYDFFKFVRVNITGPLDRETSPTINMTLSVTDGGEPALTSSAVFTINVLDENDNAPQFSLAKFEGKVPESTVPGRSVLTVTASDPDEGVNSIFNFTITAVQPAVASGWLNINPVSGEISVDSLASYDPLLQPVQLTVTATDNGDVTLSNSTIVAVSFTPPYSFAPRSFQQYEGYDLFTANIIYLEFRTGEAEGVLFYQMSPDGSDFTALELIDKKLYYTQKQNSVFSDAEEMNLLLDVWYSVLIDITNEQSPGVSVWTRDEQSQPLTLLKTASSSICQESGVQGGPLLFIGGLKDAFAVPVDHLTSHDFSGCIATVVINSIQLDMECPQDSRNVVPGCLFDPSCQGSCMSECVKYGQFPGCPCPGGFDPSSCSSSSDYEDIAVEDGGFVQFSLGYDFFYESAFSSSVETNAGILQTISISVRPAVNDPAGVIFYSSTKKSQQLLELDKSFRYTIYTDTNMLALEYIYDEVSLSVGVQYNITLEIMNDITPRLILSTDGNPKSLQAFHITNNLNDFYPFVFASEPETVISLGGTKDEVGFQDKQFAGCMSHFTIDSIPIPLQGLNRTKTQEFSVEGSDGKVVPFCHACLTGSNTCPQNSTCIMDDLTSKEYTCMCLDDFTHQNNKCIKVNSAIIQSTAIPSSTATPGTEGVGAGDSKFPLEAIIGVAIFAILIVVTILIGFGVACRWAYVRGKKTRFPMITQVTYHVGSSPKETEAMDGSPVGSPLTMNGRRQNAYVLTTLRSSPSVQEDTDNDSTTDLHISPCSLKRKTASNETGFQSASEMEDGRRSFPVVSDSSNEHNYNEQYSSTSETESDYFTNTSGIVHALSPSDMRLVSSGSVMGVPNTFRLKHPLTSRENQTLQVFRPDSAMLSDTDTDVSTTTNNAGHLYSDNETNASDAVGPKWYKSSSPSTIVDGEPSLPYAMQAAVLHKHTRHPKRRPPNLKQFKVVSPPHNHHSPSYAYYNGHHPPPHSSSPLVHSNRFDFPPTGSASARPSHAQHFPAFELEMHHRLPAISESMLLGHYSRGEPYHHPPLQHQRYSDNVPYTGERLHVGPLQSVPRGGVEAADTPPYYAGYHGSSLTPGGEMGMPRYRDLNSFPKVNPITYYEQQERMRPTVDQDDSLNFLSEPYVQFEDVSTEPSVVESTVVESTVVDEENELPAKNHQLPVRGRFNGYTPSPLTREYKMATTMSATNPQFGRSTTPTETRIFSPASSHQFCSEGAEEASVEDIDSTLESIDETLQEIQGLSSSSSVLHSPYKSLNHFPSADCTPPINSLSGDTLIGSSREASPRMNGYLIPAIHPVK